jgi:hypothetical protein
VHSAEQPSERKRDRCSRMGLIFDSVAQRHFTGLFLGISNSTRSDKSRSGSQTSTEGGERKTMIGKITVEEKSSHWACRARRAKEQVSAHRYALRVHRKPCHRLTAGCIKYLAMVSPAEFLLFFRRHGCSLGGMIIPSWPHRHQWSNEIKGHQKRGFVGLAVIDKPISSDS